MKTSAIVKQALDTNLVPVLREHGFTKFKSRTAWRYFEDHIWVFETQAVGSYFSVVTGFPPSSISAHASIFYHDFPGTPLVEQSDDGLLVPKECICHVRYALLNIHSEDHLRQTIESKPERARKDIWWVARDGSNIQEAVADIARSLIEYGLPLLKKPYNTRSIQLERRGFKA